MCLSGFKCKMKIMRKGNKSLHVDNKLFGVVKNNFPVFEMFYEVCNFLTVFEWIATAIFKAMASMWE